MLVPDDRFSQVAGIRADQVVPVCDGLSAETIDGLLRKWLRLIPHPFTAADRKAGYRYDISILQTEFSTTQVLDRPLCGRLFFEQVIRENLDLGRPQEVQLIFNRKITRRTPGRLRTRIPRAREDASERGLALAPPAPRWSPRSPSSPISFSRISFSRIGRCRAVGSGSTTPGSPQPCDWAARGIARFLGTKILRTEPDRFDRSEVGLGLDTGTSVSPGSGAQFAILPAAECQRKLGEGGPGLPYVITITDATDHRLRDWVANSSRIAIPSLNPN